MSPSFTRTVPPSPLDTEVTQCRDYISTPVVGLAEAAAFHTLRGVVGPIERRKGL